MAFDTPTLDASIAFTLAHFASLFPEDDITAMSFNYLWCVCLAAAVTDNHANINAARNDVMPDTAEVNELGRWAAIRGVTRKSATGARKANALRVVGVAATVVPAYPTSPELVDEATGLRFKITAADVVAASGHVDVDVAALDTGAQTRLSAGAVLRFSTPVADLEELAELQIDLDEDGDDAESDGSLRLRMLSRFSTPPLGGQAEDYVQWVIEVTGWNDAYCYPIRAGLGTVDVVGLHAGSGAARIPDAGEVTALQAIIDSKRPVGVKQARVLLVDDQELDVEVTIVPNGEQQFTFDWDDTTAPIVASWEAGAVPRKVTLTLARPATMKAGDRISIKRADGTGTGKERVIESLVSTDAFILEVDANGDIPAAADLIYAGGPLVEPARAAIQAHIDSLGPANPDSKRYGAWEGNLRPGAIGRKATDVDGVLDGTVIAPAATVEASDPAFPDDGTVGLIIAGRILVRAQH